MHYTHPRVRALPRFALARSSVSRFWSVVPFVPMRWVGFCVLVFPYNCFCFEKLRYIFIMVRKKMARRRRKPDPNHPKRAKSSFMFFSIDERPKVQEDFPGIAFTEVGVEIGKRWNDASEKVKAKYRQLSEDDRARYAAEMETYAPPPPEWMDAKEKKEPIFPKRALSAFSFYCNANRTEMKKRYPKKGFIEVAQLMVPQWKELDEKLVEPFLIKAQEDQERFDRELTRWRAWQE